MSAIDGCASAVAFGRTGGLSTGEFETATVLQKFGDAPMEDALMSMTSGEVILREARK
jgi:hypothetical protein